MALQLCRMFHFLSLLVTILIHTTRKPFDISDPTTLPRRIRTLKDLGEDFGEPEYASALIHGRSLHKPYLHPAYRHNPAAVIHFRSHHPKLLELFTHFATHAASSLAIPCSPSISLPTQRSLWTVLKSPFIYKKSQENFERTVHKRMIKAWDTDPQVIDMWVEYLRQHAVGGVGMRVTRWEHLPLQMGQMMFNPSKEAVKGVQQKIVELSEKIVNHESKATVDATT
jgi:small subunit ribosomal protein S10